MIYIFGDCELDTHRYEFRITGESAQLEPKVFDVLVHLIENRDRVVTKNELLSHLWLDQHISEATLNHAIMAARKAIGDDGQRQAVIRTHRGRGYRFIADIVAVDAAAEPLATDTVAPPETSSMPEPSLSNRLGPSARGERKTVTVLSCALANTADLMDRIGPDRVHHLLQQVFTAAAAQVRQYDGIITNILEGSLLAMFGAPVAYEDHARRAVLAAVGLQQRLNVLSGELEAPVNEGLALRVGLHTGQVLIGSIGIEARLTSTSIDRTTELAVCCQASAPIGTILVSATTQRLLDDVVQLESEVEIPGVRPDETLWLYRVVAWRRWRPLLGQPVDRKQSPFVGRQRELATLQALLAQAASGRGQVIGFMSDPGMGKSRLLRQFCQSLDKDLVLYLEGNCLSYSTTTPYVPVLEVLRQVWNIAEADASATIMSQVRDGLEQSERLSDESIAYVLNLFGIQDEALTVLSGLTPEAIKNRTFALLRQLCFAASRARPVILAVEDLHWIDATSEEFLASLVEYMAGSAILLLFTYRTGYQPPWMGKSYTTQMALTPLAESDSLQLVQACLEDPDHPSLPVAEIIAKAAGNPFFIEELSQDLSEQEATVSTSAVPDTIQAVLAARIDRLPAIDKRLLQTAAVIGKDIPLMLLRDIADLSDESLNQTLMSLQAAEFLYEKQDVGERVYTFKHALTQEVAYQSLLAGTRRILHERITQVLANQPQEGLANRFALLAHHYTEAGMVAAAIETWYRAGANDVGRSAHVESMAHFTRGLTLLEQMPEGLERSGLELKFRMSLGVSLMATKGYGAPEVEATYRRARELSEQVEDPTQRSTVLQGLWGVALLRAEHRAARDLAAEFLLLAESLQAPLLLLRSHLSMGMSLLYMGELDSARRHLEHSLSLYDSSLRRRHTDIQDPKVLGLASLGMGLWLQGYPEQALAKVNEALETADILQHPFSQVTAATYAAALRQCRREPIPLADHAAASIEMATEQGFTLWVAMSRIFQGWAQLETGSVETGLAAMSQGLRDYRATRSEFLAPYMRLMLVEGYQRTRQVEAGLAHLSAAINQMEQTGERWLEAELRRLEGALLLRQDPPDETAAEACFQLALDVSRQQGARSLELRATVSLCQLWNRQGKKEAAHALLTPLYNGFSEGHDTVDLQSAKAILDV